jgi:hypothetical protein
MCQHEDMAGGMSRRVAPSLAERSGRQASPGTGPVARHCWADPPGHPGPWPGLVVEWRRDRSGGWEGRCIYAMTEPDAGAVRVVERWLPASALTRA